MIDLKQYDPGLLGRALIGDYRNIAQSCLNGTRPRTQYMHTLREHREKVLELLEYWTDEASQVRKALSDILRIYEELPKPSAKNQTEYSQRIIKILETYGYTE